MIISQAIFVSISKPPVLAYGKSRTDSNRSFIDGLDCRYCTKYFVRALYIAQMVCRNTTIYAIQSKQTFHGGSERYILCNEVLPLYVHIISIKLASALVFLGQRQAGVCQLRWDKVTSVLISEQPIRDSAQVGLPRTECSKLVPKRDNQAHQWCHSMYSSVKSVCKNPEILRHANVVKSTASWRFRAEIPRYRVLWGNPRWVVEII